MSITFIYGVIASGAPAMGPVVTSETITVGSAGTAIAGKNACRVTAIDAACWISMTGNASADPRIYLAIGASFDFVGNDLNGKQVQTKAYP